MRQRDLASLDTLSRVANDLAGEFRLEPLLELILRSSVTLLGCESGSLCLVEPHTHTYRKQIDMQAGMPGGAGVPARGGRDGRRRSRGTAGHLPPLRRRTRWSRVRRQPAV